MTSCTSSEPTAEQAAKGILLQEVSYLKPRTTEWLQVELLEQTEGKLGLVARKTDDTYTFYLFHLVAKYTDAGGNKREQGFLTIVRVDDDGRWQGYIRTVKGAPSETDVKYTKVLGEWPLN
jgi:hypothetical protein